jgi:hypothetical protein
MSSGSPEKRWNSERFRYRAAIISQFKANAPALGVRAWGDITMTGMKYRTVIAVPIAMLAIFLAALLLGPKDCEPGSVRDTFTNCAWDGR